MTRYIAVAELRRLWHGTEYTTTQISQMTGIRRATISSLAKRMGLGMRKSSHRFHGGGCSDAVFAQLWADTSLTITDIAAKIGVSRQAASYRGMRMGLGDRARKKSIKTTGKPS